MPSEVHEAPLEHIGFILKASASSMPLRYGKYKVAISHHRNTRVAGKKLNSIPDIHLTISATGGKDPSLKVPRHFLFVESAFSETEAHVKEKLKTYIRDYPDALAVMMINIIEVHHSFPAATSSIAKAHALAEGEVVPLSGDDNPLSASYDGVTLCDVASVSIAIWLRRSNADKPINLDDRDSSVYAEGVSLFCFILKCYSPQRCRLSTQSDQLQRLIVYLRK